MTITYLCPQTSPVSRDVIDQHEQKILTPQEQRKLFLIALISSAVGGYMGGYLSFPFEGIKKRLQRGELLSSDFYRFQNGKLLKALHPLELYRGSTAFANSVMIASFTSITVKNYLKNIPSYDENSTAWSIGTAVGSGMLGSIVGSTPVENTLFIQQEKNVGPFKAIQIMLNQGFTRPWVGARELMFREGGFAGVMLWGGPAANKFVKDLTGNDKLAFIGELFAGAAGALLTHPADCVATYRQKFDGKVPLLEGVKLLHKRGGIKAFYEGAGSRIALFTICAVTIPRFVDLVKNGLNKTQL
jgi:hypothetical protein